MVVCEPNSPNETFHDKPVVIAEVISEATRRTDEGEKRVAYLTIPSLMTYLLIETDQPRVVVHQRADNGFITQVYEGMHAVIPLAAIDAQFSLTELFERTEIGSAE